MTDLEQQIAELKARIGLQAEIARIQAAMAALAAQAAAEAPTPEAPPPPDPGDPELEARKAATVAHVAAVRHWMAVNYPISIADQLTPEWRERTRLDLERKALAARQNGDKYYKNRSVRR